MSSLANAAASLARLVHIRVSPAPLNISERKGILQVLQGFGEVVMFRSLGYELHSAPHILLAMYRNVESAQKLIGESPIRFTLEPHPDYEEIQPLDIFKPKGSMHEELRRTPQNIFPDEVGARKDNSMSEHDQASLWTTQQREFRLIVDVSTQDYHEIINTQAYPGKFEVRPNIIQRDLEKTVPLMGLSEVSFSKTRFSRLRRKDAIKTEQVFSLSQLWEEGMRKAGKNIEDSEGDRSSPTAQKDGREGSKGWGLKASIQQAVHDMGKMIGSEEEERPRKYGSP